MKKCPQCGCTLVSRRTYTHEQMGRIRNAAQRVQFGRAPGTLAYELAIDPIFKDKSIEAIRAKILRLAGRKKGR